MRKVLLLLGILCLSVQAMAQNRTITGRVTNAGDGSPIPNATITIKGTSVGVSTDDNGRFSIPVGSGNGVLVISSIGYDSREVSLSSSSVMNVTLVAGNQNLEEVIVLAYGTVKKSEFTGSSAQINADDFAKRPITNVLNALVGSSPGIQTTTASGAPGSSPGIRLRGFTSFSLNSSPLIVVDGVVYDGGMANINPDDVESVSTLKDAATTALYGSRGANGVILITTKKGKRGRHQLSFKVQQGFTSRAIPEYERVNPSQYYPLMWESYRNDLMEEGIPMADANGLATGTFPRNADGEQQYDGEDYNDIYQQLGGYNPFRGIANNDIVKTDGTLNPNATGLIYSADDLDWFKAFFRNGSRSDYSMNYNGGSDKSDYFGSFSYTNEKGFVTRSDLKRFSGRVSVNTQPTNWFKTGFNISGSLINSDFPAEGGIVNPFSFARDMGPIYPVFAQAPGTGEYILDALGNRQYDIGNVPGVGERPLNQGRHAIWENILNEAKWRRSILSGRAYGEIILTPHLRVTTNISTDLQDYIEVGYDNPIVGDGAPAGRASREINKVQSFTFNQLANYARRFGDHNITALAGHENYDYRFNYFYGFRVDQGFSDGNTEFGNFATINTLSSREDIHRIESYLSRVSYDYQSKYYLTGSFRRDGNSKFGPAVRWDNFWSVGLGWRIENEAFLQLPWIDQLKPRVSYGKVGNEPGSFYGYQGLYGLGFNDGPRFGIIQTNLPNPALKWETATSLDLGLDFSFFKGRLFGSAEYFNRITSGLIFNVNQPYTNGGSTGGGFSVLTNVGELYNKGVELQLTGEVVRSRDFSWAVTLNATSFKNKVTAMPPTNPFIVSGTKRLEKGRSIYDYYLRSYYGVDPEDGSALYIADIDDADNKLINNGKGGTDTVTADISNARLMYNGKSAIPDVYGSIQNAFRYKNFELSFLFTYQLGGWIYDGGYAGMMHPGVFGRSLHIDALQRWQNPGDVTNIPKLQNERNGVFNAASDRWLISGTHVNLNNINLSYTLPASLSERLTVSNARIYLSAENVYLFSKRRGTYVNQNFAGTVEATYPAARVVTAGITLTF